MGGRDWRRCRPYFRVQPVTQAEKLILRHGTSAAAPELAALPVKARFAPWQHPLLLAAHARLSACAAGGPAGRDALAAYRQSGAG